MEQKRNYVVYTENVRGINEQERVIKMTDEQADAIQWLMDNFDISGTVKLAEEYNGEEI